MGSSRRLARIGNLNEIVLEVALALLAAAPDPLPYDRCHRLSTGEWADPPVAACTICELRELLGDDTVETVKGVGYRAGPLLLRRLYDCVLVRHLLRSRT